MIANEKLALQYQQGNKAALSALWEQTKRLMFKYCYAYYSKNPNRCAAHGIEFEDLMQECFFALIDAVLAYKPSGEYKLLSYLKYPLKNRFNSLLGLRAKKDPLNAANSLNKEVQTEEDSHTEFGDLLRDETTETEMDRLEKTFITAALHKDLKQAMNKLKSSEKAVIQGRYFENKTLRQLSYEQSLCSSRIGQLERSGLRMMKYGTNLKLLSPYMAELDSFAYYATGFGFWKRNGSVQEMIVEKL